MLPKFTPLEAIHPNFQIIHHHIHSFYLIYIDFILYSVPSFKLRHNCFFLIPKLKVIHHSILIKMNCKDCQSAQYEKNDQGQTVCAKCGLITDQLEFQNQIAFNSTQGVYGSIVDRFDDNRNGKGKSN